MELTKEAVLKVIEDEINPQLAMHNGGAEVLEVNSETNEIVLKLTGGCVGCPSAQITLFQGVEPILREHFPDVSVIPDFMR